ncbi:MAG TPA: inositol-3-phosphate synthase [Stellaceae bacterium]|nr:inositol-3-phosphate synthase [Candidatus Tumulicola sp.]HXE17374.1 inositol-3-phosphate synthase [Stellaceae bacterium]
MSQKVRVAIAGVGNCASALIQGVAFYRGAAASDDVPGLMHIELGGYHIRDIEFVAAYDVNHTKVGRDLADAIRAEPNDTASFATVAPLGVKVERGPTLDGIGPSVSSIIRQSDAPVADVAASLKRAKADVLVSYLPVGSQQASEFYAEQALAAGCAFVNCIPVFIASSESWRKRFEAAGLPLIGDDIKSQVGATIVHRVLARLFDERGVHIDRTYQLNFGGNMDFLNMLDAERVVTKKQSKTQSVMSQLDAQMAPRDVHIAPSDHVRWLGDRKWCYIRIEGTGFGNTPLNCELKLEVWDSPNSAGVVIDAVRCAKLALDRGIKGALQGPSAYFMKSPPKQFDDNEARRQVERFIDGS